MSQGKIYYNAAFVLMESSSDEISEPEPYTHDKRELIKKHLDFVKLAFK